MTAILADGIFKSIFLDKNDRIAIKMSLKFVPRSPIENKPALVQLINGLALNRIQDPGNVYSI